MYLKYCLEELRKQYAELGIIVNEKKTQIIKLSHGFTFLKMRHYLTDTGKVVKKPGKDSIVRERRKLKRLKRKFDDGEILFSEIQAQYRSWRGHIKRANAAYHTIENMDRLYNSLFVLSRGGLDNGEYTFQRFQKDLPGRVRKIMRQQNIDYIPRFESSHGKYRGDRID